MPLRSGYSYATYHANVAEMVAFGHERNSAIMAAASHARKCFFHRFPRGALPIWLAYPKIARTARYYDKGGRPLRALAQSVEANPVEAPDLRQATALYRGFTGKAPRALHKTAFNPAVRVGLAIGKVFGIMYSVDATNERFHHEFKGKARPTLIVASDGKSVYLRGGAYTFTKRGFTDSPSGGRK